LELPPNVSAGESRAFGADNAGRDGLFKSERRADRSANPYLNGVGVAELGIGQRLLGIDLDNRQSVSESEPMSLALYKVGRPAS